MSEGDGLGFIEKLENNVLVYLKKEMFIFGVDVILLFSLEFLN